MQDSSKEVKINPQRSKNQPHENFYFTVLDLLSKGLNQAQISSRLGLSKQALNYYFKRLKANGEIKKVGYGTWEINPKKEVKTNRYGKRIIRGHAFRCKVHFKPYKSWNLAKSHFQRNLTRNKIQFKEVGNTGNLGFKYRNNKIWICKNFTIHVFFRKGYSIFAKSGQEAKNMAHYELLSLVRGLESILRANFKWMGQIYKVDFLKHHYAYVNNEIAQDLRKKGHKFIEFRDEESGELWGLIDNSFNLEEFETVFAPTAVKDQDLVIVPFMNKLRKDPLILDKLENNSAEITNRLKQLSENQMNTTMLLDQFDSNIRKIAKEIIKKNG